MLKTLPPLWLPILLATGCAGKLPDQPPPLADMIEPLELFGEPDDEAVRQKLPLGTFTGAYVGDARDTLESMLGESEGIEIVRIVENSPADLAGLWKGDLLLEARIGDGAARPLKYPSQWREVELNSEPGSEIAVVFDRANRRGQTTLEAVARVHMPDRDEIERVREELRVGVVLRTATEVEARSAGLAPGAGAVIVGLSKASPWRASGLAFGDLIVEVDGQTVSHPQVVLDAIRAAEEGMTVVLLRDGERHEAPTLLSQRGHDMREIYIPLLYSYEYERGRSEWSILLGLFGWESTQAAWRFQFLWFIHFGGGDADRLLKVDE